MSKTSYFVSIPPIVQTLRCPPRYRETGARKIRSAISRESRTAIGFWRRNVIYLVARLYRWVKEWKIYTRCSRIGGKENGRREFPGGRSRVCMVKRWKGTKILECSFECVNVKSLSCRERKLLFHLSSLRKGKKGWKGKEGKEKGRKALKALARFPSREMFKTTQHETKKCPAEKGENGGTRNYHKKMCTDVVWTCDFSQCTRTLYRLCSMEVEKFICFGADGKSKKRSIEKFTNSWKSIRRRKNLYIFSWFVNCESKKDKISVLMI